MPTRLLYEKICDSVTLAELTGDEERLFHRLVVKADDYGRFHAHPALIAGACLPLLLENLELATVEAWRDRLADVGLIRLYEVDGREYLEIVTWPSYQRQRGSKPKFPLPPPDTNAAEAEISGDSPQDEADCGSRVVKTRRPEAGSRRPEAEGRGPVRAGARDPSALANGERPETSILEKTPPPERLEPTSSEYRLGESVGLSRGQVDQMADAMLDHYRAVGESRADWHSTLRGWLRKSPVYDQSPGARSPPNGSHASSPSSASSAPVSYLDVSEDAT